MVEFFPGAYAPGYALFRPFGPKKTREQLQKNGAIHRTLLNWFEFDIKVDDEKEG